MDQLRHHVRVHAADGVAGRRSSLHHVASPALRLERAGADFLVLATNTMHKLVPRIEQRISIPVLHIADATARTIADMGLTTVGLLG
ncbi:MAG TPA: aspartate/glutamate racemase family protein, partial [Vicinamibacterales bacterium]|nr:aspartate/glutamate racemase family protein [Vicinamibacterales bacterium]